MSFVRTKLVGLTSAVSMLEGLAPEGGTARYSVGTNVEYAPYVEFGTYKMAAQPYMRPAAREVRGNLSSHLSGADSVDAMVKSIAQQVERRAKQKCPVDTGTLRASIRTQKVSG